MKINNIKKIIKYVSLTVFVFLLNIAQVFAQDNAKVLSQNFKETADNLTNNVLSSAGTLLMTAAFVVFFYGVVIFIIGRATGKGNMKDLEKGKQFMMWGLVALFVMVSVWGIIRLAQNLLDVKGNTIEIQPVKFAALDVGTTPASTNPLKQGGGGTGDDSFKKAAGEACKVLSGTDTECASGMLCRGEGGVSIPTGQTGTCQNIYNSGSTNRPQGAECVGQPGSQTQCASGMFCRDSKGIPVAEGKSGTCKNTLAQEVRTWPVIKIGQRLDDNSTASSYAISLFAYLQWKKCTSTYTTFGTTYDEPDANMVKNFQRVNNLKIDGEVGENTWAAVVSPNSKSCS